MGQCDKKCSRNAHIAGVHVPALPHSVKLRDITKRGSLGQYHAAEESAPEKNLDSQKYSHQLK